MARNAREIPASTVIMAPFPVAASLQTSKSFELILKTAFVRRFSVSHKELLLICTGLPFDPRIASNEAERSDQTLQFLT